MKKVIKKILRGERGQALPMVLILIGVSGLIVAPLLFYMSSGLSVGMTYERLSEEFYAADAGVEDALWHIDYDQLETLFDTYNRYDYQTTYSYPITYPVEVNDIDVLVSLENVWIPQGIDAPEDADDAQQLIDDSKLIITGNSPNNPVWEIKIYYDKEPTDGDLVINEIGIWLPAGLLYDEDSECTLETWMDARGKNYTREISEHCGGQAVVWTFNSTVLFTDLPDVVETDSPMYSSFTFEFINNQPGRLPEALSWIETSGVGDIPYAWDADVRIFHINSKADGDQDGDYDDDTIIDAYALRSEMREISSSALLGVGDYRAIGNTLMVDNDPQHTPPKLDELLNYSDATVNDIPENAQVEAAFLYWSGWVEEADEDNPFEDDCHDMSDWIPGADWQLYYTGMGGDRCFRGHHQSGGSQRRYLTMQDSVDLSSYPAGSVKIQWEQWTGGQIDANDCLLFEFSNDGGNSWGESIPAFCGDDPEANYEYVIPAEYLTEEFKIRFYLDGFSGSGGGGGPGGPGGPGGGTEYCYLDDIIIATESASSVADLEAVFKIDGDTVYYAEDEYGELTIPTEDEGNIFSQETDVLPNGTDNGYSYSCYLDVTELVRQFTATGNGNATYTMGQVDADTGDEWSYAAWSLIIVYDSPDIIKYQLYLYPEFIYVDNDGVLEYPISGFLVPEPIRDYDTGEIIEETAAKITCFVAEGDDYYEGDYITLNPPIFPETPASYRLWDGTYSTYNPGSNTDSNPSNVWNGKSTSLTETGIDIDTFLVSWESGLIETGDASALVALETDTDSWNMIYIILAFRSEAVSGGTVTYLITDAG